MKLNEKKTQREKSSAELMAQVTSLKKEYAVAKMQFKVGKLANPKLLSSLRKKLAYTLTLIQEKAQASV